MKMEGLKNLTITELIKGKDTRKAADLCRQMAKKQGGRMVQGTKVAKFYKE